MTDQEQRLMERLHRRDRRIDGLRAALKASAAALESTAKFLDEMGQHGTAQGVQYDARMAGAALSGFDTNPDGQKSG